MHVLYLHCKWPNLSLSENQNTEFYFIQKHQKNIHVFATKKDTYCLLKATLQSNQHLYNIKFLLMPYTCLPYFEFVRQDIITSLFTVVFSWPAIVPFTCYVNRTLNQNSPLTRNVYLLELSSWKHVRIMNTPLHPNFYIVKLGFTRVYIFSYFWSKT